MRARAELDHRLGDADRRAAVEALGTHHEAGRLSPEEVEDRQLTVANAQTWSDVVPLFADLPMPHPAGMPRAARGAAAGRTGGMGLTPVQRNAAIGLVTMGAMVLLFSHGVWFAFLLIPATRALLRWQSPDDELQRSNRDPRSNRDHCR